MKTNDTTFTLFEQLIYDLLFTSQKVFNIILDDYCTFEYRPIFKEDLRIIIKRGGLKILDDRIIHTNENIIWKLEIKR